MITSIKWNSTYFVFFASLPGNIHKIRCTHIISNSYSFRLIYSIFCPHQNHIEVFLTITGISVMSVKRSSYSTDKHTKEPRLLWLHSSKLEPELFVMHLKSIYATESYVCGFHTKYRNLQSPLSSTVIVLSA